MKKPSRKPEVHMMRVVKGGFTPADGFTQKRLRDRGLRVGDLIGCTIKKARSPGFHRKAHRLGQLVEKNIEGFEGVDAHTVLKRLQLESGIGCEEIRLLMPGIGPCSYRVPLSLSYDNMDQTEFEEVYSGFCQYIIKTYWPGMTEEQIEQMASLIDSSNY